MTADPNDPIHVALMALGEEFPSVYQFQRINHGFYRVEGFGTCEMTLARNSDKLLVQLDSWNRGVRGELVKFLSSVSGPAPTKSLSEKNLHSRHGNAVRHPSSSYRPQDRQHGIKEGGVSADVGARPSGVATNSSKKPLPKKATSPVQVGNSSRPTAAPSRASFSAAGRRLAGAVSSATPRQEEIVTIQSTMGVLRHREGGLFVHCREPLFGEPMVLLRAVEAHTIVSASDEATEPRALVRLLCSGRIIEVIPGYMTPLEVKARNGSVEALVDFEGLFLSGHPEETNGQKSENVFGSVELSELNPRQLSAVLIACWPHHTEAPVRGLGWALRSYFIDWLKRRQRLRNFTQLVVALPCECLQRGGAWNNVPRLESILLNVMERDLLIVLLLTTPYHQRARLYVFAAETGMPLPLGFPNMRSPCPFPWEPGEEATASLVDRGLSVHWNAFEALLARPADRPLLLSMGAQGCSRCGKSSLIKELLGVESALVPLAPEGTSQSCSPCHAPGVDLLRAPASGFISWIADAHGCSLGDPAYMALIATLASTASYILLHISADDFYVQSDESRGAPLATATTRPGVSRAGQWVKGTGAANHNFDRAELGPPRVSMKPDLLALLRLCLDARLPGLGSLQGRVLVFLRDANLIVPQGQHQQVLGAIRTCVEGVLGSSFSGICSIDKLTTLCGGHRQRALAVARSLLRNELASATEASRVRDFAPAIAATSRFPNIDTLKKMYSHFFDRLTLAGEKPVLAASVFASQGGIGDTLAKLLDEAEAKSGSKVCVTIFPVSEIASQLAWLKVEEKRLLENQDSAALDDALIARLAGQVLALERSRRDMLAQPLSSVVRFFVETVLADGQISYAKVFVFAEYLSAWKNPRLAPLLDRRRSLLDARLEVSQDRRLSDEVRLKQLADLEDQISKMEHALEQLNISLDCFWAELAAVSELSSEMQGLGILPPENPPYQAYLKEQYARWAWSLNQPLQLLHGSPLQCAGSFLVDVLKDLGASQPNRGRELFVISVIGIQSSAKSTLLNYLFGCGFQTSAGRCTRGLYCSLMEAETRTLLLLDTEGLMSLEAAGGDIFDAQLALMAMACSHLVLINHKGELSRQLQDLLEVCLFAMQHLKVTKLQPKLLFVLRDQHDRSHGVHSDALRLMRRHLAEASDHLSLHLDDLISLDPDSIFLLPSAFACDVDHQTGAEMVWSTHLFAQETLRLRRKIFQIVGAADVNGLKQPALRVEGGTPEFSTLPDWCLHTMSVWRVLDRYGPNLLHYKTIQEIEVQRELEDLVKHISAKHINGVGGLADTSRSLLNDFTLRLGTSEPSEQLNTKFRSSLLALLDQTSKRCFDDLEDALKSRHSKFSDARKDEAKKKLQTPVEYQGELTRYTWALSLTEAVDRDQLRALKVHFKRTIEELWQAHSSQPITEDQANRIFASEWTAFEEKCKARFEQTTRSSRQLAEEVCLVFNHMLRQHRHSVETLQVVELVPAAVLLSQEPMTSWEGARIAQHFFEVCAPQRLADYAQRLPIRGQPPSVDPRQLTRLSPAELMVSIVVPEVMRHLGASLSIEIPEGSTQMPGEDAILEAMKRLGVLTVQEEERFLLPLGVRFQGGRVAFLNATQLCLRHSVLRGLVQAEERRIEHQWTTLQSHRQRTEDEFMGMVQRHSNDAGRAKMLAELLFDALAREWLDETLVSVAAAIRSHCLADMPDASGAAERAYQQAFVERNWTDVLEYVLDVNAYLHKIFTRLFEERKASITRAQRPLLVQKLGSLFDAINGAGQRWGHRVGSKRTKLSSFQVVLRELAAESRAGVANPLQQRQQQQQQQQFPPEQQQQQQQLSMQEQWPLLSERFPVVADFEVDDPSRFAQELRLQIAARLGETNIEALVGQRLEAALQKQQAQVWALIRGCPSTCPCCGSKCSRVDTHTEHICSHHLFPAFNGWRVAGSCEAALDACKSHKNHQAPKRSDFSDHLFPNLEEYLRAEHPEWLPFPKEDREIIADSVLKAAWVNCRAPLLHRYDMVDSTPQEWISAYEETQRKLHVKALDEAEVRLSKYGYDPAAHG